MAENILDAMSNVPKTLVAQSLPTSNAVLLMNDGNKSIVINTAWVSNMSGTERTANLSVTKAGGGTARLMIDLDPGESCVVDELFGFCLGAGDYLSGYVSPSGAAVDIALSGSVSS